MSATYHDLAAPAIKPETVPLAKSRECSPDSEREAAIALGTPTWSAALPRWSDIELQELDLKASSHAETEQPLTTNITSEPPKIDSTNYNDDGYESCSDVSCDCWYYGGPHRNHVANKKDALKGEKEAAKAMLKIHSETVAPFRALAMEMTYPTTAIEYYVDGDDDGYDSCLELSCNCWQSGGPHRVKREAKL